MDKQKEEQIRKIIPMIFLVSGFGLVFSSLRDSILIISKGITPSPYPFNMPPFLGGGIIFIIGIGFLISYMGYRRKKIWPKPFASRMCFIFAIWAILVLYQSLVDGILFITLFSLLTIAFNLYIGYFLKNEGVEDAKIGQ